MWHQNLKNFVVVGSVRWFGLFIRSLVEFQRIFFSEACYNELAERMGIIGRSQVEPATKRSFCQPFHRTLKLNWDRQQEVVVESVKCILLTRDIRLRNLLFSRKGFGVEEKWIHIVVGGQIHKVL